jgi:cyclophilin family peptidyl-prolyl cis-trans isomerase
MVLSTTLSPIGDVTVLTGAPLHVALDGFDGEGDALTYEVSVSGVAGLSAQVLQGNRGLKMSVAGRGDMTFALFEDQAPDTTARIIELAESGFYDGLTFHRVIKDFMIQGGDPKGDGTGGSGTEIDDEFDPGLQFTSSGLLAMAKGSDDTGDSQFFITSGSTRWLDFNHTIFGFLVEGDSVREAIENVPADSNDKPTQSVVITSVTVFEDHQNGVLVLSAPAGTTGQADVTVTVRDGNGHSDQRTFHVTLSADDSNANPFLGDIEPIVTSANTPVEFDLPAVDVEGDAILYAGLVYPENDKLLISVSETTGHVTLTPTDGLVGVHGIYVGIRKAEGWDQSSWDTQAVPVFITPAAPTGIRLAPGYDTGPKTDDLSTTLNNAAGNPLKFDVSGVLPGAEVILFIGGVEAGRATAQSDSVQIVAAGVGLLDDGTYPVSAQQILVGREVTIGNRNDTVDLQSGTVLVQLTVDNQAPQILSDPVLHGAEGKLYAYDVQTDEEPDGGMTYELVAAPAGMTVTNASTGKIAWTPAVGQAGTHQVTVKATDGAGNATTETFEIEVFSAPVIDPIAPQEVNEGSQLSFTVTASGGSGALSFSLDTTSATGASINPATGLFTWTPGEQFGPSQRQIVVRVTDAAGASATEAVSIKIFEVNRPPTVGDIADRTIDEGQLLSFSVVVSDPDVPKNLLEFGLADGAPDGAAVNPQTGLFTWTPSELQGGQTYTITVQVLDRPLGTVPVEKSFQVTVGEVDNPPVFDTVDVQEFRRGERLEVQVSAVDPDLDDNEIRYSLDPGAPSGAAVDPVSGALSWDVPGNQPLGSVELIVRATEVSPGGQTGLASKLTVEVTVIGGGSGGDTPGGGGSGGDTPVLDDAAIRLLSQPFQRAFARNGPSGAIESVSLPAIDLAALDREAAPVAGGSDGAGGESPIGGASLFGTQLDPGSSSGGGAPPGEEGQQPDQDSDTAPSRQSGEGDGSGDSQDTPFKVHLSEQSDAPDLRAEQRRSNPANRQPEHQPRSPEAADAALAALAETSSSSSAEAGAPGSEAAQPRPAAVAAEPDKVVKS